MAKTARILSDDEVNYLRNNVANCKIESIGTQINLSHSTICKVAKAINLTIPKGKHRGIAPKFTGQSSYTDKCYELKLPKQRLVDKLTAKQEKRLEELFSKPLFKVSVETKEVFVDRLEEYWASA